MRAIRSPPTRFAAGALEDGFHLLPVSRVGKALACDINLPRFQASRYCLEILSQDTISKYYNEYHYINTESLDLRFSATTDAV